MLRRITLALAVIAFAPAARADLIGINFTGGGGATGPVALAPTDVAGAVPQANWNNLDGPAGGVFGLLDGSGANTGVLAQWESPNTWSSGSGTSPAGGNDLLMGGYLDSNEGFGQPSVRFLFIPYAVYDVYVYIATDAPFSGRDAFYTVNGVTQHIADYGYDGALREGDGGNYLVFRGVTGSALSVVGNEAPNLTFRSPIAGIQIRSVPEPAGIVLAGLGLPAFVLMARRKRA